MVLSVLNRLRRRVQPQEHRGASLVFQGPGLKGQRGTAQGRGGDIGEGEVGALSAGPRGFRGRVAVDNERKRGSGRKGAGGGSAGQPPEPGREAPGGPVEDGFSPEGNQPVGQRRQLDQEEVPLGQQAHNVAHPGAAPGDLSLHLPYPALLQGLLISSNSFILIPKCKFEIVGGTPPFKYYPHSIRLIITVKLHLPFAFVQEASV